MSRYLFFLLLVLAVLVGCEESVTNPADKSFTPHFRISEGSYWVVNTVYEGKTDTLRYVPTSRTGSDGKSGWAEVTWSKNDGVNTMLAKQTAEGLVYCWDRNEEKPHSLLGMKTKRILTEKGKSNPEDDNFISYLVTKFPVEYQEEWILMTDTLEDNQGQPGTFNDMMKCVNLNQSVSTPAGDFVCIVYKETYEYIGDFDNDVDNGFSRYYYYAEGVGLVKILYVDNDSRSFCTEYELIEFHLN